MYNIACTKKNLVHIKLKIYTHSIGNQSQLRCGSTQTWYEYIIEKVHDFAFSICERENKKKDEIFTKKRKKDEMSRLLFLLVNEEIALHTSNHSLVLRATIAF